MIMLNTSEIVTAAAGGRRLRSLGLLARTSSARSGASATREVATLGKSAGAAACRLGRGMAEARVCGPSFSSRKVKRSSAVVIWARRVGVIGACVVEVSSVSWLGTGGAHRVPCSKDQPSPARGPSGNIGYFDGSSVTPVSIPRVTRKLRRRSMGLPGVSLPFSYLPAIAAWLVRFCRAGAPEKGTRARATRTPRPDPSGAAASGGASLSDDLIRHVGHPLRHFAHLRGELGRDRATGFRLDERRLAALRTGPREFACHT